MAENDYTIKPVEGLQSVTGLSAIGQREERNKKQEHKQKHEKHFEEEVDLLEIEQKTVVIDNSPDENKLDFRA
jgi:hypothetical protein